MSVEVSKHTNFLRAIEPDLGYTTQISDQIIEGGQKDLGRVMNTGHPKPSVNMLLSAKFTILSVFIDC